MRCKPGSLVVIALDCSSFCLMSRGTTGRSVLRPWGNLMHEFVCSGNVLSSRVALLIFLCQYLKLRWILEQPDGSFLPDMPHYQQLWRTFEVWQGYFWMGLFNGPSPKRHRVWSNCKGIIDAISERAGFMSREQMGQLRVRLANHYEDKNGVKRHTGKPKDLQKSQPLGSDYTGHLVLGYWTKFLPSPAGSCLPRAYTREFGEFLAKYFVEIMKAGPITTYSH
ncbi:unnamed protein product [Symbiodinium sp. CCMP2592]|nr:unnamed protein product [Symbiodinium sp. CCMP2592]